MNCNNRMMLLYMFRQFPSHLCTIIQLHSADNRLRIKSLESFSSGSHYQLSRQSRYKFMLRKDVLRTEACGKKESCFGRFTNEAKLDNDNNCDISKYKLLLAVQYRLHWSKRGQYKSIKALSTSIDGFHSDVIKL